MRRAIRLAAVVAAFAWVFPVGAQARAFPPLGITFKVETTFGSQSGGPFVANGAAADFRSICPAGTTEDIDLAVRSHGWPGTNFQVVKRFTCADNSGYLDLKPQVRTDRKAASTLGWSRAAVAPAPRCRDLAPALVPTGPTAPG